MQAAIFFQHKIVIKTGHQQKFFNFVGHKEVDLIQRQFSRYREIFCAGMLARIRLCQNFLLSEWMWIGEFHDPQHSPLRIQLSPYLFWMARITS